MDEFVHENQAVAAVLEKHFLIMKVNYSNENRNKDFLAGYPKVPAYPHFFVLDSDGGFLHSQGTAELEEGRGYNENVFLEFLAKWKPDNKDEEASRDSATEDSDQNDRGAIGPDQAGAGHVSREQREGITSG